jgi:hypothetical protein
MACVMDFVDSIQVGPLALAANQAEWPPAQLSNEPRFS